MKMFNEEEILDVDFRKMVIDEIEGNENLKRKDQMKRRYEVYKDNTKEFVLAMMEEESQDEQIVKEVINRMANISFCRKIIDKKAMVYKDGVKREVVGSTKTQGQIETIADYTKMNTTMKKTNKYTELFKNAVGQVLPYVDPITLKYYYKMTVIAPYLYDVIEDGHNPEIARAYITSYYSNKNRQGTYAPEHMSGYRDNQSLGTTFRQGDGKNQIIADSPNDQGAKKKEYVWWTNKFHFTTDEKGELIGDKSPENLINPIGELPFYNFSQDQDGHFWAVGGEDLIDGSILLNMLLSDLFYIAKYQGMGIGYMFGKGVPTSVKVGASSFVTLETEADDPTPQIGFATSNPPIQAHLDMMETYIALLLSTNKLEVGSIQSKLSATTAASGIHEMIKRAENVDDIQNQREIYRDGEPALFRIMSKWHNIFLEADQLVPELAEIGKIDESLKVKIKFPDPQPYISEKEKLEIIKMRKELGLDSLVDLVIRDNPELSEKEAVAKIKKTLEQKLLDSNNKMKLLLKEEQDAERNGISEKEEQEEDESEDEDEIKKEEDE